MSGASTTTSINKRVYVMGTGYGILECYVSDIYQQITARVILNEYRVDLTPNVVNR